MNNYYKVTSATIEATKRGYKLYKLQLDNSLWVTKLLPFDKLDQEYDPLYKIYEETNSLESLIGKYIVVSLISNKYGKSFNEPYSIDLINDFKKLLDKVERLKKAKQKNRRLTVQFSELKKDSNFDGIGLGKSLFELGN